MLQVKRAYEDPSKKDGCRILVDRMWPRGISKDEAHIDLWLKEIAPSDDLRKWFDHDPDKWKEFQKRYREELADKQDLVKQVEEKIKDSETVTLVFAAKDEAHNNAVALKNYLEQR